MSIRGVGNRPQTFTPPTNGEVRYPKLTTVESGRGATAAAPRQRPESNALFGGGENSGKHLGVFKQLFKAITQLLQALVGLLGGQQPGGAPSTPGGAPSTPGGAPSTPGGAPTTGGMPDLSGAPGGAPSTPGTVGIGNPVGGRTQPTPFISQYNPAGAGAGYTNGAANCAPTSMAMIARSMGLGEGLTDAQLINKLGAVGGTDADGTSINGVVAMANELGVNAEIHGPRADPTWIAQTLASGKQIVANGDYYAAPGHYEPGRSSGHYITVTGMNQDGTVNVQDPADPNLKTMTMQELATFMNANKINGGYAVAIG